MNTHQLEPIDNMQEGEVDDIFPFYFKTIEQRSKEVPGPIAQQWSRSSHFFFFLNGLCDKDSIERFLMAQTLSRLDDIASAFDIETIDLVGEKRRREGAKVTEEDRATIVESILSSVTC